MTIKTLIQLDNDISFHQLNQAINSLNIFKSLGIEHYEIRYSNFLSWLLDPQESHQLKDYFLRKVMEHILLMEENEENQGLDLVQSLMNESYIDSYVFREVKTDQNRFIDLLVSNHRLKMVLFIENKFFASESANQLNDYLDFIQRQFHGYSIIPVYLTLDGELPSNRQYFSLTYERINHILEQLIHLHRQYLDKKAYYFISDYYHLLKERFDPSDQLKSLAIEIYQRQGKTIDHLFDKISSLDRSILVEPSFEGNFLTKYGPTIAYIYNHGKNILSYSFKQFIQRHFTEEVICNPNRPNRPSLLPPEWRRLESYRLREKPYWEGVGIVVWFEPSKQDRLKIYAELGPIEYPERLTLLKYLEAMGIEIKEESKEEDSRFTKFFSDQVDINRWDDIDELSQAMEQLYFSPAFSALRKNLALALENKNLERLEKIGALKEENSELSRIQHAFKAFMTSLDLTEHYYRMTSRNLSFNLPLFDRFKEKLGETREKWWWHHGPFLCWMEYNPQKITFILEVGPIESSKRVELMQHLANKDISFREKGFQRHAKYTRIFSESRSIHDERTDLEQVFHDFYGSTAFQEILVKLEEIYKEQYAHVELDS